MLHNCSIHTCKNQRRSQIRSHKQTNNRSFSTRQFRRESTPSWGKRNRYDDGFHGYFFTCHGYGQRDVDYRRYARRDVGRPNIQIRCWTCGLLGHAASVCRTMRCYNCDGFGHRARDCWYSRRQPMRNGSTKRTNEPWRKGPGSGIGSGQKASVAEQGKAHVWMKKT